MKTCNTCGQEKPLAEFCKYSKSRSHLGDGFEPQCKECRNARQRSPEFRERGRLWYAHHFSDPKNRERKREKERIYAHTEKGKKARAKCNASYRQKPTGKISAKKADIKRQQNGKAQETRAKYNLKFPDRRKAAMTAMYAVRSGKLIRPGSCSVCNKVCIPQGPHPDYSKPLEVVWLCHNCHVATHWYVDV